jgi:hypothetical protein
MPCCCCYALQYDFVDSNHSKIDANIAAVITQEILKGLAHLVDNRVGKSHRSKLISIALINVL